LERLKKYGLVFVQLNRSWRARKVSRAAKDGIIASVGILKVKKYGNEVFSAMC
jgi:hypothetical protein